MAQHEKRGWSWTARERKILTKINIARWRDYGIRIRNLMSLLRIVLELKCGEPQEESIAQIHRKGKPISERFWPPYSLLEELGRKRRAKFYRFSPLQAYKAIRELEAIWREWRSFIRMNDVEEVVWRMDHPRSRLRRHPESFRPYS